MDRLRISWDAFVVRSTHRSALYFAVTAAALGFFILCAMIVAGKLRLVPPVRDAKDYVAYALAISDFGIFGKAHLGHTTISPAADNLYGPLLPAAVATLFEVSPGFKQTVICYIANPESPSNCQPVGWPYLLFNVVLASITLGASVWIAVRLARALEYGAAAVSIIAGLTGFLVLLSPTISLYVPSILTEMLLLTFSTLFFAFVLKAIQERNARSACLAASGICVGLLSLTKPSYLYPAYFALAALIGIWIYGYYRGSQTLKIRHIAAYLAGVGIVLSPWIARNALVLDSYALSSVYGGLILVQRTAYNHLEWSEIAAAFIYWLPDFGDNLGKLLFSTTTIEHLGFGPNSMYHWSYELGRDLMAAAGGRATLDRYVIVHELLSAPLKYIATTAALAWRAIFIDKYLGYFSVISAAALIIHRAGKPGYASLLILTLPVALMVVFHAAISISIPRYNEPFLAVYAVMAAIGAYNSGFFVLKKARGASA
jgi:hypothetical protein